MKIKSAITKEPNDPLTELLKTIVNVHSPAQCSGQHCCIHNPSDHHMRSWKMVWRADKGVVERICPHGVGHPDPDDASFNAAIGRVYLNVHGCDGCCDPTKEQS